MFHLSPHDMPNLARCQNARRSILVALLCLMPIGAAQSATLLVGPGGFPMGFAQAIAQAKDGDQIDVLPGTYKGDVAVIAQRRLRIRGVATRPVFEADGKSAEGKAIWVVRDGDVEIENIEFRGARVADNNGAGIRFEKGRLLVRKCRFIDNQNGILTSNFEAAELRIEDSEFAQAPHSKGILPHLLYVGRIGMFSVTGSRFHQGFEGHLIKSRARSSRIAYNLIYDGRGGAASYEIDLPVGGDAVIIGNIIGQSAQTQSPVVVAYGAEAKAWDKNRLLLSHNTLISDHAYAWFLRAWPEKLPPDTPIRAVNNLSAGPGVFTLCASGAFDGNVPALARMLEDPQALAFELKRDGFLRGRADDPRALAGDEAVPSAEFTLPIGTQPLAPPQRWSPGALQR
jgi:hypothetical protein